MTMPTNNAVSAASTAFATSAPGAISASTAQESPYRYREAFEATAAERAALDEQELAPINIDVLAAVSTVNAAMPEIRAMRGAIGKTFVSFDLAQFDRLHTYALALQHAQVLYAAAIRSTEPTQELAARAVRLREMLVSDITALVNRGVLDGKRLAQLRGGTGFRNAAFDLQVLAAILREHWGAISSRTMVQFSEVEQAEALGADLTDAVDGREQVSSVAVAAASERTRAFTLFFRAYDEARRAATFLRWHEGGSDSVVPSLYAGRGGRGKNESEVGQGLQPAPVAPVVVAPAVVAPVVPGQPGGSPFLG